MMSGFDLGQAKFATEKMNELLCFFKKAASTPAPLHISGESGVGKSTWAQWLISQWPTLSLLEWDGRELDHNQFRKDMLSITSGLILIENVEALDPQIQRELNDIIEKRNFTEQIKLITTSRKKLKNLVDTEVFRADLYYKLMILHVELPPLRHVVDEIPLLSENFIQIFSQLYKKPSLTISSEASLRLAQASWEGNISELENVIERAVVLTNSSIIDSGSIVFENRSEQKNISGEISGMSLSEMERKLIMQTLALTEQNRTRAAQILGISIRTLRNKLNEYKEAGLL